LQTALEATAAVRILGPHTMVSRDVKYQLSVLVAAAHLATPRLFEHTNQMLQPLPQPK
jgi:hypothetical protein